MSQSVKVLDMGTTHCLAETSLPKWIVNTLGRRSWKTILW